MYKLSDTLLVENAKSFIENYHGMELMPMERSAKEVWNIFEDNHLVSSWKGRGSDFGDFYLNLSHTSQYLLLDRWGLSDYEGEEYCNAVKKDEIAMLFVTPPASIYFPHQLLKYFYNHGIESEPGSGLYLDVLPEDDDKCYGNSFNWADYILSLKDDRLFDLLDDLRRIVLVDVA